MRSRRCPAGGNCVSLPGTSANDNSGGVEVRISDTGVGIPKELEKKVFQPFFTTKDEGTGLGLAIVHGIIREHNGSIEVESEVGKGTMFTIFLPSERRAGHDMTKSILIVEDDRHLSMVLSRILTKEGYEVAVSKSAKEGIENLSKEMPGDPFDRHLPSRRDGVGGPGTRPVPQQGTST